MSWTERINTEPSYVSPSGREFFFTFEDVRREVERRTTEYYFPDVNGTYVQFLGNSGFRYPLRVIFHGDDHDREAEQFETGILEPGVGTLNHPFYGVVRAIPFGTITRRDDLKTAANQSILEVVFWEALEELYPNSQEESSAVFDSRVEEYQGSSVAVFASQLSLADQVRRSEFFNTYRAFLDDANFRLRQVAEVQGDAAEAFDVIERSIDQSITVLIGQPITLGFQTLQLIRAPAAAAEVGTARVESYVEFSQLIVEGEVTENTNDFIFNEFASLGYLIGAAESAVNTTYGSRPEALGAAETLLEQLENVTKWGESRRFALNLVDQGELYQQAVESVTSAVRVLIDLSFSLAQERRLVLDRARTIVDLCAELYGQVDDRLDFFADSNNLSGDEYLEIRRGREVVYYV